MPSTEEALLQTLAEPGVRFDVKTSLVMDLVWALLIHAGEPDPVNFPVRAVRFASAPDAAGLEQRIQTFWPDGDGCFTELFVLAERGGVLFEDDPELLWSGIAAGAAGPDGVEPFASETPEDQARFNERLIRLHDDPHLRQAYLELLRDVWAAIAPQWQGEGRRAIEASCWDLRAKLVPNGTYADLEAMLKCDFDGMLPRVVRHYAATGQAVVVTPAWFGRQNFVVSLRDLLLVGPAVPPRPAGPTAETRIRSRRFKALGDPTRLAIVEATAIRPRTVGELAEEMGVAQPTISNHVRILRDAGLLAHGKDGARRLEPDPAALKQLAEDFLRAAGCAPELLHN